MKVTFQKTKDSLDVLLDGKVLVRLPMNVIFRDNEHKSYPSCQTYINEKEGTIYLCTSAGYGGQVYCFNRNDSYPGEWLLLNIIGVDIRINALIEGEMGRKCRYVYVAGMSDNGTDGGVRKLHPFTSPTVEVINNHKDVNAMDALKLLYADTYKQSSLNLIEV